MWRIDLAHARNVESFESTRVNARRYRFTWTVQSGTTPGLPGDAIMASIGEFRGPALTGGGERERSGDESLMARVSRLVRDEMLGVAMGGRRDLARADATGVPHERGALTGVAQKGTARQILQEMQSVNES